MQATQLQDRQREARELIPRAHGRDVLGVLQARQAIGKLVGAQAARIPRAFNARRRLAVSHSTERAARRPEMNSPDVACQKQSSYLLLNPPLQEVPPVSAVDVPLQGGEPSPADGPRQLPGAAEELEEELPPTAPASLSTQSGFYSDCRSDRMRWGASRAFRKTSGLKR